MKLNLGCGDKILAGYVNVDVVESRLGKRPDVLCEMPAQFKLREPRDMRLVGLKKL